MTAPDRSRSLADPSRRTFLKTAGAVGAAAGLEGVLAARRAPALAQGTRIHLLQWVDFIPEGDAEVRRQVAEYSKQANVEVVFETINANDLQARITAAIQSGSGPDIIMMLHNWPHLYAGGLADVGDLCEWKAADQGGYYPHSEAAARLGKKWLALPYGTGAPLIAYRRSWFADVGASQPPRTLEEYKKIGIALKAKGKPIGQTLGHTFGDAPAWTYPFTWTFGGAETDPSGENILIDSKETREALRFAKALFDEGMTPEVFSWDDASDNRFLASGVGCWIHDAISAYRTTEDTNPDVFKNTHIAMEPAGPGGKRVSTSAVNVYMIWKFSKYQPAAKEFLVHFMEEFKDGMVQSRGYNMPYLLGDAQKPMPIIGSDPKMQILQDFPKLVAFYGYPGPFTTPIQEVVNLFVLPDMFTRVARGQSVDDVMKWGVGEYQRIFSKHKRA